MDTPNRTRATPSERVGEERIGTVTIGRSILVSARASACECRDVAAQRDLAQNMVKIICNKHAASRVDRDANWGIEERIGALAVGKSGRKNVSAPTRKRRHGGVWRDFSDPV